MKKAIVLLACLALVAISAIAVMTSQYTQTDDYSSDYFGRGYIINGVRCYEMNCEEAAKKIEAGWQTRDVLVVGALDEPLATLSGAECTFDIDKQLRRVKKDHKILAALNHYLTIPVSIKIPMKVTGVDDSFREKVEKADFLRRGTVLETKDAYVDLQDPDFNIVKEVYGNSPDIDRFFKDIMECVELGQTKFQFLEEHYISTPKVKSDDPQLLAYQSFCRKYLKQKITYDLGEDSYTISQDELESLLKTDLSGEADEDAVRAFVQRIATRYDNVDTDREFTSLTGKTITISDSNYGWSVDPEGEAAQLIADIESHKDVSREPVWATRGYGSYSLDIGNTYVDIDVSKQKLTYFQDGQKKFSCDVVTGCLNNGTTTPEGLFTVLDKAQNVTLKGRNANGSKYTSFVNYWIPFLGTSYGMHDATWRSSFGGDIWVTSGSHGCVNMPPDRIPEFYDMVSVGTPVIIYE